MVLAASLAFAPATASAVGTLTQKAGTAGCINNTGAGGCQVGTKIGGSMLAISPDGKSVYATGFDGTSAVAVLDRDPLSGELTQKTGLDGCWAAGGGGGLCHAAAAMVKPDGVAVSHDGKSVYVADFDQNSVMIFDRAADGALTQKAGSDGCFSASGHGGACQTANGLSRESRLVVSPDDKNVYVASSGGGGPGAIAVFDRDTENGELSQKAGADGCITSDTFPPCEAAIGLGHPEGITASPDGKSVYVTARFTDAVIVFDRAADGTLTQKAEPDGCWDNGGNVACSAGVGLDNGGAVKSPAVSPDGKNLYVPASGSGGIAIFDRDTETGAIEQKAGLAGCISWDGTGGGCEFGFGVREAAEVVVSPDGESVYLAGANNSPGTESGVAVFDRDAVDGTLTQKLGTEGCISPNGSAGACAVGRALPAITLAISPDGKSLYAGGVAVFDRDAPTGGEEEEEGGGGGPGGGPGGGGGCPGDSDCDGLVDAVDVCPNTPRAGTLDGCPLRLDEVAPRSGGAGPITVRLRGRGFKPSPSVRLVRDGEPDIAASAVTRSGAQTLSVSFDLDSAKPGKWEVVVAQGEPDAAGRLPFTVLQGTAPVLRARLLGHGRTISGYPWSGLLQVTNEGTTDARNALVRIDGFQARADATVISPGATATHVDSGNSHSLLVSIDRIPQQTTKMLIVRFSAVGPGHSFYFLRPTVLASSVPGARPVDPNVRLVPRVLSSSANSETGTIEVTGGGAASYDVQLSDQNLGDPPSVKVRRSGGGIKLELSATLPVKPKAPPGGGAASASSLASASDGGLRRIKFSAETERKAAGQVEVFQDLNGSYQLSISRKGVLDCLLTRRELTQAEHDNLLTLADGVFTAQLIKTGTEISPRGNPAITFALSYGPDFMSWQFEARLARALRDQGAGDANSRYFGLNPEEIVKAAYRNCLPNPPPPGIDTFSLEVLTPEDPNDKVGLAGFRNRRWVASGTQMPYLVMFENVPTASAPAHEVRIEDRLDASKLDLSTLELGPVYFGDKVATPPPGAQSWEGSVDLRPAKPLIVSVRAGLDRSTGVLNWHLRGLDPATGELQVLPELGFLPPNKAAPEGQGGVTFSVEQVPGLRHGAKISNGATIVFDNQGAITTPVFTNRIDTRAPTSSVGPPKLLRSKKRSCGARLAWRGKDSGAGVALQDVYLSRDGRRYGLWRAQTKRRSSMFRASRPGAYTFFSAATDGVGNAMASSGSVWDKLVRGTAVRRGGLVLRLRPKAAKKLRVRSLKVLANKRTVVSTGSVPARVSLAGTGARAFKVTLLAKVKSGKGQRTLRASRAVVICSRR